MWSDHTLAALTLIGQLLNLSSTVLSIMFLYVVPFLYAVILFSVCNASQMTFCAIILLFISLRAPGNLPNNSGGTTYGLGGAFFRAEEGFDRKQENCFFLFLLIEVWPPAENRPYSGSKKKH